jgi:hypothetical protein
MTTQRLYRDIKPGDAFVADLGYNGMIDDQICVADSVRMGHGVFGDPRIEIRTRCGLDLVFGTNQSYCLEGVKPC